MKAYFYNEARDRPAKKTKQAGAGEKQTGFATLFIMKVIIIIIYIYHMIIIIMKVKLVITRQNI